jgi:hypothetical protein
LEEMSVTRPPEIASLSQVLRVDDDDCDVDDVESPNVDE